MRRYWIEKNQIDESEQIKNVTFKDEQFHHIFDVCRQQVGHHFEVITEDSKAYLVEVTSIGKKNAIALIKEVREITPLKKPHIHILLSLPRYAVIDSTIERCVEMGVSSITPFVSDFSFIRKIKELPAGKFERWRKIVISATQQSGRGELMKLHDLVSFETLVKSINHNEKNWCLLAYEGKSQVRLQDEIQSLESKYASLPDNVFILVGSEGGFSSDEINQIEFLGLRPVTLGAQILRVETACLTLVAILKYQFDLMK
jgi:16S rRNA (uracil1498-N3)-methyltransferase